MFRRFIAISLVIELLIANIAPIYAQPNLKFPWDRSLTFRFTSGPHGGFDGVCVAKTISTLVALDFALSNGTEVLAAGSGTVKETGWSATGGWFIKIDHSDGWETRYYHLSEILVEKGDWVPQGALIGKSGKTGSGAGGYHLHFEVRPKVNGVLIDGYKVHAVTLPKDSSKAYNYLGTLTKGQETVVTAVGQCGKGVYTKGAQQTLSAEPNDKVSSTNRKITNLSTYIHYLIRAQNAPTVYFVENGKRRAIPDPETLFAMGYGWNDVQVLDPGKVNQIPLGDPIPSVKDKTGPQVSVSFGVAPQGGGWFTTSVPVTITASDPSGIAEIAYQVGPPRDPDGWTRQSPEKFTTKFTINFTISKEGIRELYFNAKDKKGYWGSPEGFTVIPIDFTQPATTLSYNGPSYQNDSGKIFVSPETGISLEADDTNPNDPAIETSGVAETKYQYHTTLYDSGEKEYEEPFPLEGEDGNYTISYHSTDVAGNIEPKGSQEVHLDSTPPVSSDNSDGGWHKGDVAVLIVSSDGEGSGVKAIYYSGAKEDIAEGDQVVVIFENEGVHELSYFAVDNVENIEEEKHVTLIKIDKTPPEITGAPTASPNENGWYNEDVIVHFEAEDQLDLSGLKSVTPDVVVLTEGRDQEVVGAAEDSAGNTASTTVGGINIDKTDPSLEVTFPEEGEYYNAESWEGEVRGIVRDNLSGIESVEVGVEEVEEGKAKLEGYGELETGWEYPLDFAEDGSDDGYYTVYSRATDLAGNQGSTFEVSFVYDNTPPTSEIADVEDRYINKEELDEGVELPFSAEDNIELKHVRLYKRYEGGEWDYHYWTEVSGTGDGEFTVKSLKLLGDEESREGLWEFASSAEDKANNVEAIEGADTWIIYDVTAPTTSVDPSGLTGLNGWYVSPVTLQLFTDDTKPGIEVSGVSQVFYTINGFGPQVYSIALTFWDGEYVVEFWSIDRAGNIEKVGEENVLLFKVDTTDPTSKITSLEEDAYYNNDSWPGIYGTADDNLSGVAQVEIRIDKDSREGNWEPAWETDSWSLPNFVPSDGFYTVYSRAIDFAGNQESTFVVSFVYDATPPITSVNLQGLTGLNGWYVSPVTLTLNPLDQTSGIKRTDLTVIKDGKEHYHTLQYDSENPFLFEEDGTYVVRFWSEDLAGNIEQEQEVTFKIDTTSPTVPAGSIPSGAFTEGETLRVGLTAEEGAKIYYFLNGSEPILYSGLITITDDTTLSAYAVDEAGNQSALVEFSYVFSAKGGSTLGGNPAPQVLGVQSQETPGVSQGGDLPAGEAGVKDADVSTPTGEDSPQNSGSWPIPLVVMLGGVSYLLLRRRILPKR